MIMCTFIILEDDISETTHNSRAAAAAKFHKESHERIQTGYHVEKTGSGEASESSVTWLPHLCPRYKVKGELTDQPKLTWMTPTENTIFFTQTSCSVSLTGREACAVESAAHHHPHRPLLVFMTAPAINYTHPLIQVLAGLSNVQLAWLNLDQVFSEEPLRTWHSSRLWLLSDRGMSAVVSDVARVELLRRHGGTYLDLDALTLRPLPADTNWLARIDERLVGNAVMSFTAGHPFLQAVVADIPSAFEPSSCCSVGPDLITRDLQRLCPSTLTIPASVGLNQTETCGDITVWPSKLFCPIHYGYLRHQLQSIFREGEGLGPAFFKTTEAFSLHLFHSLSHRRPVSLDGDSILKEVATRNCPRVVQVLKRYKTYI